MTPVVLVGGPAGSGRRAFVGALATLVVSATGRGVEPVPPGFEGGRVRLGSGWWLHLAVVDGPHWYGGRVLGTVLIGDPAAHGRLERYPGPVLLGVPPGSEPPPGGLVVDPASRESAKAALAALLDRVAAAS